MVRKKQYENKIAQLSFGNEDAENEEEQEEEEEEEKEKKGEEKDEVEDYGEKPMKKRNFGKNPNIDTSFLPVLLIIHFSLKILK